MNKNSIEIPLVKATYEELQQVICELQVERYKYKTTIDKIKEYINKTTYKEVFNDDKHSIKEFWFIKDILELLEEIE
jgi:hypothetical protein